MASDLKEFVLETEFAQLYPHHVCQSQGKHTQMSKARGFCVPCRDPRCSRQCYFNYTSKQAAILAHYLSELPDTVKTYRGNLKMPDGVTRAEHHSARKHFMDALGKWRRKNGKSVKIKCVSHIIDKDGEQGNSMHYDFVLYCDKDIPHATLYRSLKDLWVSAGGSAMSCVPLPTADRPKWAYYVFKTNRAAKQRFVRLPCHGGLDITWGSNNFYSGTTTKAIWGKVREKWFPRKDEGADTPNASPITLGKIPAQESVPQEPPLVDVTTEEVGADREFYMRVGDSNPFFQWCRSPEEWIASKVDEVRGVLDKAPVPDKAIGASEIAALIHTPVDVAINLLRLIPSAARLEGWVDEIGRAWWNMYYHNAITTLPSYEDQVAASNFLPLSP